MSLFDKLFGKLLGKNETAKKPIEINVQVSQPIQPGNAEDYLARWDRERKARAKAAEIKLRDWLIVSVKQKEIKFTWESGGDEGFVDFDDHDQNTRSDNFEELEMYVIDVLDIPSAGEFSMTGEGAIYLAADEVKIRYSSVIKGVEDFNEETEEQIYGEEEKDSGDFMLFKV